MMLSSSSTFAANNKTHVLGAQGPDRRQNQRARCPHLDVVSAAQDEGVLGVAVSQHCEVCRLPLIFNLGGRAL